MRQHYLDNLKWMIILWLIPFHAAQAWNTWDEPNYIMIGENKLLASLITFTAPYIMPLMFVIAGISASFSLHKRGSKQFLRERVRKLLIPFVFGVVLVMPWLSYIADCFNNEYEGDFLSHLPQFFTQITDLTGADGNFSLGQFWFILYLFLISIACVGVIALVERSVNRTSNKGFHFFTNSQALQPWKVYVLGLPIPLLSPVLSFGGKSLLEYLYMFLLGYYVFSNPKTMEILANHSWRLLGVGIISTLAYTYLIVWENHNLSGLSNLISPMKLLSEWFMTLALLGVGKRYLNFRTRATGYVASRSYKFYCFHFFWVVLFQALFFEYYASNTALLYLVPVALAYLATLGTCEIAHRVMNALSHTQPFPLVSRIQ